MEVFCYQASEEVTYSLCLDFGFYPKYNRKPGTHFFT